MITKYKIFETNSNILDCIENIDEDGIKSYFKNGGSNFYDVHDLFQTVIYNYNKNKLKILNIMIDYIDINFQNDFGHSYLMFTHNQKIEKFLLDNGINVNLQAHNGKTALIFITFNNSDSTKIIINHLHLFKDYDLDLTLKDDNDNDFLDYVDDSKKHYIIKVLEKPEFKDIYHKYLKNKQITKFRI